MPWTPTCADLRSMRSSHAPVRRSAHSTLVQWRVNELLAALSDTLTDNAEELARAAVSKTGRGDIADKMVKNQFASRTIFESLINETTQGVLSVDADQRVTELASPVGVVFAVGPIPRIQSPRRSSSYSSR